MIGLKISTRGRYGLTIIVQLGRHYGEGPVPLRQIAEQYELSEAYLEQLVRPLRKAGIVKSVRGAQGGYELNRAPHSITAGDVIREVEGPITVVDEIDQHPVEQKKLWLSLSEAIRKVLDETTIDHLLIEDEAIEDGYMFYI